VERPNDDLHVACPHCGFRNFAISAYCGRCERPLRGSDKVQETLADVVGAAAPERPPPRPEEPRKPPLVRPPLAAVPPPTPPPVFETPPPAPLPIELPRSVPKKAAKRARRREKTERRARALAEFEVALPSTRRTLVAQVIDFLLVGTVGVAVALTEASLLEDGGTVSGGLLDQIALWIHLHPGPALHGLVVAGVVGALHTVLFARGGGRSVGRLVTDTVLVHRSGTPISWRVAILRAAFGLLSLAAFGAGFFWAVVDPQRRTWQDVYAGTVLVHRKVKSSPAKPATPRPAVTGPASA